MEKNSLEVRIEAALDSVRSFLQADGGDVALVDVLEDMTVNIKLLGQCRSCHMSAMTMKAGIEDAIKRAVPEVVKVVAIEDDSF